MPHTGQRLRYLRGGLRASRCWQNVPGRWGCVRVIEAFRLANFKAFKDTGEIRLKPLTVLAGSNSSGKSSLLQSLLLLKQTLETSPTEDVPLNLSGRFLQFSTLSEVAFRKPPATQTEIGYEFIIGSRMPSTMLSRYFPQASVKGPAHVVPVTTDISLRFRQRRIAAEEDASPRIQILLDRFSMTSSYGEMVGPSLSFRYSPTGRKQLVRMGGPGVRLPAGFQRRQITGVTTSAFIPDGLILESREEEGEPLAPRVRLDTAFTTPLRILERSLTSFTYYLGPLREEPHRAYLHSGTQSPEIGAKGEYAAQILWLERDEDVIYKPSWDSRSRRIPLIRAVNDAFKRLGVEHSMDVRSWQSLMYQIVSGIKGGKEVTIADVGFGVSQLLPILVLALRAPTKSLLLFEQPEIHLHPRVQANLADFFLGAAKLNAGAIIVETHSDHFINRLRRRVAEDETDELRQLVSILFVKAGTASSGSHLEPLAIDSYGAIENWPPDFLPEGAQEAEAILRAALRKRGLTASHDAVRHD